MKLSKSGLIALGLALLTGGIFVVNYEPVAAVQIPRSEVPTEQPTQTFTSSPTSTSTFTPTSTPTDFGCGPTPTRTPFIEGTPPDGGGERDACAETETPVATVVAETATPTPTVTDISVTETATATPVETESPTVIAPIELILNGGFETPGATEKLAADWKAKNPLSGRRKCNQPAKILAYAGNCAYLFKSGAAKLIQKPVGDLQVGDTLLLSAWVSAKKLVNGGTLQLRIRYTDAPVLKTAVAITAGTYPYVSVPMQQTITGTAADLRVQIRGGQGKIFVDEVSLLWLR